MCGESTPASPPFYSGRGTRTNGGTRGGAVEGPLGFSTRRIDALCGDWTRHRRHIDSLWRRQVRGSRGERMTTTRVHTPTGGARREARAKSRTLSFRSRGFLSSATPSDPRRAGFGLGSPDSMLAQSGAIWALGARLGEFSPHGASFAVLGAFGGAVGDALTQSYLHSSHLTLDSSADSFATAFGKGT